MPTVLWNSKSSIHYREIKPTGQATHRQKACLLAPNMEETISNRIEELRESCWLGQTRAGKNFVGSVPASAVFSNSPCDFNLCPVMDWWPDQGVRTGHLQEEYLENHCKYEFLVTWKTLRKISQRISSHRHNCRSNDV